MSGVGGDREQADGDDPDTETVALIDCLNRINLASAAEPYMEQLPSGHLLAVELKSCVGASTRACRRQGRLPESTIVFVKQLLHEHLMVQAELRRSITDQTVRQVVDAYFDRTSL